MRILLTGYNGAMGKFLVEMIQQNHDWAIVGGVDRTHVPNTPFPQFETFDQIDVIADVIIDFSHHSLVPELLKYAERTKTPAVICTTGLSDDTLETIHQVAQHTALFKSGNMSLGINLLIDLAKKAAELLGSQFDIEIIEKHHHRKVDAPSGTALMIADAVNEVLDHTLVYQHGRHGREAKRQSNELGLHAVRGGSIVGEHEIIFAGDDEIIEIKHSASSRRVFAQGALKAAAFLIHQPPGLYDMNDLIQDL